MSQGALAGPSPRRSGTALRSGRPSPCIPTVQAEPHLQASCALHHPGQCVRALGLGTLEAHPADYDDEMVFEEGGASFDIRANIEATPAPEDPAKKPKGRPPRSKRLLKDFHPLAFLFGQAAVVKRWLRGLGGA